MTKTKPTHSAGALEAAKTISGGIVLFLREKNILGPEDFTKQVQKLTEETAQIIHDETKDDWKSHPAVQELLEAAKLRHNALIWDDKGFKGKWFAIPAEDLERLQAALEAVKGER